MEWRDIKVLGIGNIEKCVGEFKVSEIAKTPYGSFKVKIYERQNGKYIGYTNLLIKDEDGCAFPGVGHGETIETTLKDTIEHFLNILNQKQVIIEHDFECADPYDF